METTCWTRGYPFHSNDPMRQVFIGSRDEQDWCKPKIADTTGSGLREKTESKIKRRWHPRQDRQESFR